MPSVPRIVVVDPNYEVTRIVRGAMTLLSRQHILVEVPTAEDALHEVLNASIALVVSAYQLPGDVNGIDLATRISRESLGTALIVLGEENDPRLDHQALQDAPFQYFLRPVGEPFLRGLRIALDGKAAVVDEQPTAAPEVDLGPVPNVNINQLRSIIISCMRDVGAMGAILADRTGRVLVDEGATGYIDREKLAVILGPSFARSAEISPMIGGNAWTMHYYDGERLDVYGLALGLHYFMCLIFEGSNRGAFGAVKNFGRRAADQMIEMMGDAAYGVPKAEPLPLPRQPEPLVEAAPVSRPAQKPAAQKKTEKQPEPVLEPSSLEPVTDFDADLLFGQQIDEALAANMFDPEALGALAESLEIEEGEHVGYDEAINMGILDE